MKILTPAAAAAPLLAPAALIVLGACSGEEERAPASGDSEVTAEEETPATIIENVDVAGALEVLASGNHVVILDVRTPAEYAAAHIDGAVLVDYKADDFAQQLEELDKSVTYLLHCESGGRSTRSLKTFEEAGFAHIVHLDGGIRAWKKAGQPIER